LRRKVRSGTPVKFILNLNGYRNVHYRNLAAAKRRYRDIVFKIFEKKNVPRFRGKVKLVYRYYHGSRRRVDVMNPVAIIDKFVCDALTEWGAWADDNTDVISSVDVRFCGIKPKAECRLTIIGEV